MSKWLPDVSPEDRAVDVAARSLAIRLANVRRYLKRSIEEPGLPQNIHRLRVWSRRSEAALALYADILPPRRSARLEKKLKRIRRTAGRIRDCDVFAEQIAANEGHLPAGLKRERKKALRKLAALYELLDHGRTVARQSRRLIERFEERNERSRETHRWRAWTTLEPMVGGFFQEFPGNGVSDERLHEFRIAGKRLRYAMELLAGAFPASFRDELYPHFAKLQERLGAINDLSEMQARFRKHIGQTGDPVLLSELGRQASEADEELIRARKEFHEWWTPETAQELRDRFDGFLSGPRPIR